MAEIVDCRQCRQCGGDTKVTDSRPVTVGSLVSIRRKRACLKCSASYRTLEMPEEVAAEMWEEE